MQGYIANLSGAGTKTSTPLREIPQSVTVVTADRIKDQGATTVQESVRYVPGVYADAYGPDSRAEGIRIRGQEPNIYLDGMRMNSTATYNEWRPDPFTLERVEVLRGPSSMIYGDTSVGGLLNLISKRPQAQSSNEIGVQFGSFERKQVQIDSTGKLTKDGEWLYRFVGVFRDSNYQTDYVKDDRIVLAPSLTWRPTKNTTWTVLGTYQKDKTGSSTAFLPHEGSLFAGPNGFVPVNRFVSYPGWDKYQTESGAITSLFEHSFSENLTVRQNTRYVHADGIYRTAYPDSYANPLNPFVDAARRSVYRYVYNSETSKDFLTSDSSAELKFATGPVTHKTLFGVDYRDFKQRQSMVYNYDTVPFDLYSPVYNPVPPTPMSPVPNVRQSLLGIYAQDQMRLGQWLLTAGVRHDTLTSEVQGSPDTTITATTGRVGLMYELPFGLTPYVTYAQSFNPVFAGAVCAALCAPQRGELVELGFKYNVSPDVVINGAVYDTTEKNRLAAGPIGRTYTQIGQVKDPRRRTRAARASHLRPRPDRRLLLHRCAHRERRQCRQACRDGSDEPGLAVGEISPHRDRPARRQRRRRCALHRQFLGWRRCPAHARLHAVRRHDPLRDRPVALAGQCQQPGRQAACDDLSGPRRLLLRDRSHRARKRNLQVLRRQELALPNEVRDCAVKSTAQSNWQT